MQFLSTVPGTYRLEQRPSILHLQSFPLLHTNPYTTSVSGGTIAAHLWAGFIKEFITAGFCHVCISWSCSSIYSWCTSKVAYFSKCDTVEYCPFKKITQLPKPTTQVICPDSSCNYYLLSNYDTHILHICIIHVYIIGLCMCICMLVL